MERYVIHVTKKCNMDCFYCYEEDKSSGDRSWEDTKNLIDDILKYNNEFEVEFLGGEPMMNFPLIKRCINYLKDKGNVKKYIITTNGTIINEEIVKFLMENSNVCLGVSLDGNRFMNSMRVFKDVDGNKINSYEKVIENLENLKQNNLIDRVFIHMVIHPYNVGYLSDAVDHFYNKGYKNIDIGIVEKTLDITEEFERAFIREHDILSNRIRVGMYPELIVTTLDYKPDISSERTYIKNKDGITVAESYGRVKDFTDNDNNEYEILKNDSKINRIKQLKLAVYNNHKNVIQSR
ncbi:radical SAM protein [Dethiothermospora halolimnae]|uniref:radical SAM protein n=1 Tax=Dethiothermospora halolimnae TaxID=3114390 RepID=UPI003CCC4387